jgi:hypothetical protein
VSKWIKTKNEYPAELPDGYRPNEIYYADILGNGMAWVRGKDCVPVSQFTEASKHEIVNDFYN